MTVTDLAPVMVEKGRARTEGPDVRWQEADVEELPFDAASFDWPSLHRVHDW